MKYLSANKKKDTVLLGVVYNRNGIATWCIEAARALIQSGKSVVLITTSFDWLPSELHQYAMLTKRAKPRSIADKVSGKIKWWLQFLVASRFNEAPVKEAFFELEKKGIHPQMILVAQTDFLWPKAPVPQWVVARTWPINLKGYLSKMNKLKSQPWLNRLHDLFFWYRMDHKAFRHATGVLAISQRLTTSLVAKGYNAKKLYPCVSVANKPLFNASGIPRFIIAAQHLGDKNKNIPFLVEVLGTLYCEQKSFALTLVGFIEPSLEKRFCSLVPHVRFTGRLTREELQVELTNHDIFLFASLQENWGYVLSEALALGLVIITPDMYPFDEVNPNLDLRFIPNNQNDCKNKIDMFIGNTSRLKVEKEKAFDFYFASFSPQQFCKELFLESIYKI